jgi:hypothetical protein
VARGWLYDGETALRHEVDVHEDDGALLLAFADGRSFHIRPEELDHIASRADAEIYGRRDRPGWRLGLASGIDEIRALLPAPERYGRWIDRVGLARALVAALAISALVIFAGARVPGLLAPLVPQAWEKRFGDALVGDLDGRFCAGPGGQAALKKLVRQLSDRPEELRVHVINVPGVNAVALPGGNILIFDGLLKEAESSAELAGILAHEVAHIDERHTTQTMIRQLGISTIVVGFGGTTGASIETLLAASYSQGAEAEADDAAIRMLAEAGISPAPTAGFFRRLAEQEAKIGAAAVGLAYLSTHPLSAERERKFRGSAQPGRAYRQALGRDDWEALVDICHNDPRREEKRFLPRL